MVDLAPMSSAGTAAAAQRDPDDLPGSVRLAQSAHDAVRQCRRAVAGERHAQSPRADGSRRGTAAAGRLAAGVHASLSACLQWRAAAAYRHRAGAGDQSAPGRGGRTGVGIGRVGAGAGAEPAAGTAIPAAADVPVRRARSVRGAAHLRPRRGDVCRATGGTGADRRTVFRATAASLYGGADARGAGA